MLKQIARAALPFLAATAIAQAADRGEAGMVTFIDHASGRVMLDNAQYVMPASLAGIRLGEMMPAKTYARGAFSTLQKAGAGAAIQMTANGRITFIDAGKHRILVGNVMIKLPASYDIGQLKVGTRLIVDYTAGEKMNSATRIAIAGKPAISFAMAAPAGSRITYIDRAGRAIMVDNAWMAVPESVEIDELRVGDSAGRIIEASKANHIPARG